jgi:hypothetical protein
MGDMYGVFFENGYAAQNFGKHLFDRGIVDIDPSTYQGSRVMFGIQVATSIDRLESLIVELSRWDPSDPKWENHE